MHYIASCGKNDLAEAFLVLADVNGPASGKTGLLQRKSTITSRFVCVSVQVQLLHLSDHPVSMRLQRTNLNSSVIIIDDNENDFR